MIAVADGQMSLDEFARQHLEMSGSDPEKAEALAQLMGRAMVQMNSALRISSRGSLSASRR